MRRSPSLIVASVLLLLAQAVSPAMATAVAAMAAGPERAGSAGGQDSVADGGRWIVLCTASGLRSVFLTADGRVLEGQEGSGETSTGPVAATGLVCPLSVLAGAVLPPPAPTVFDRARPAVPVDLRPRPGAVVGAGAVTGGPLGARAPPTA